MGIHPLHFRKIVVDTLDAMGPPYNSPSAVELLLLTAAKESELGRALWQYRRDLSPGGPACGPFQMEPGRFLDTTSRWSGDLGRRVSAACYREDRPPGFKAMAWDLRFATAMARAAYWLVRGPLPAADDIEGLDDYYMRGWCRGCASEPGDAARAYRRLVIGKEG